MSVETKNFYYEGEITYNNVRYLIKAKQRRSASKVEAVVESAGNVRNRFGKEFEDVFEFIEWLKDKQNDI